MLLKGRWLAWPIPSLLPQCYSSALCWGRALVALWQGLQFWGHIATLFGGLAWWAVSHAHVLEVGGNWSQ